jgi:spermidine/putrescine transport system ATP-binding protein
MPLPDLKRMDHSTALLRLERVRKTFGQTVVLNDISFSIAANEFLTLLGPSGSGKTTILRLLGGFDAPSAGTIHFDGADISAMPINRRPFNTVFQDYALFPHMSVRDNVGYGLMVRRAPKAAIKASVDDVLAVVGLEQLAGRLPAQLSGGQRQRVALARAIVCKPRVILLDEPLAALDVALRASMCKFLKDMQRRLDVAFVYVTHDQTEAILMSDRIVVLKTGEIEQIGTPAELYRAPRTRFVAAFFGENNLLDGRAVGIVANACIVDTRLGRLTLAGLPAGSTDVTVAIRSEHLRIAPAAEARAIAVVRDVQFAGPTVAVDVEIAGEPPLALRMRLHDRPPSALPDIGGSVGLTWSDDDAVLIPGRG